jgi:hypothetical protein
MVAGHKRSPLDDKDEDKERRDVTRTRISRNAKIIVPQRSQVLFCTVENITNGGACLKLATTSGVPPIFELTFEHGRTRRLCRVMWRTADRLGIAFDNEQQAAD